MKIKLKDIKSAWNVNKIKKYSSVDSINLGASAIALMEIFFTSWIVWYIKDKFKLKNMNIGVKNSSCCNSITPFDSHQLMFRH